LPRARLQRETLHTRALAWQSNYSPYSSTQSWYDTIVIMKGGAEKGITDVKMTNQTDCCKPEKRTI
jgi:hypothetical protein